jgi:kinetochore protein NDC80
MAQHKETLQSKIDERTAELKKTMEKSQSMEQRLHDLKQSIANQEMSPDDLTKVETEKKGVKEATERTQQTINQRKEALRVIEIELAQHLTQLDVAVAEFNAKLSELGVALGHSPWNTYKASISKPNLHEEYDCTAILGTDLHDTVLPHVQKKTEELEDEVNKKHDDFQNALDQFIALNREFDEAKAKCEILRDKANKAFSTLDQEQQAHLQKQGVRQREVNTLEQKITSLRDPVALEEQMAGYRQQCATLETELAKAKEDHTRNIQDTQRQIHQALCLMHEHEALVEAKLQELEEYWKQNSGGLEPLTLP